MQLSSALLSAVMLASSAMALPNGLAARGPGPACVVPPFLYGCGTPLHPRCCTLEEYESKYGATPTATTFRHGPTPLATRAEDFVCPSPLFGCGTRLAPACCTLEQYVEKFCELPENFSPAPTDTPTATIAARAPDFVCPSPLFGCGTHLVPACCTLEQYVEKFCELPPTFSSN